MNVKLLFAVFALALVVAGWFAGAGATATNAVRGGTTFAQAAAAPQKPELDLWSASPQLGVRATTDVLLSVPNGAAEAGKMTLYVPAGYPLNPADPVGTKEGTVVLQTASDFAVGDLKAADPAAYVNTPQAQACAPGAHVGVWTMNLGFDVSSTKITVPVYIDSTSGSETALGAYKLQACLPLAGVASPGGSPLGSRVQDLDLEFTRLTNPTSAGLYVWRGFVSNPDASGNPDPTTTYELRSDMPLPAKLGLTGKLDRKHHRAVFSGRLSAQAMPVGGVPVSLYRVTRDGNWTYMGATQTSATASPAGSPRRPPTRLRSRGSATAPMPQPHRAAASTRRSRRSTVPMSG
jgi:hypothetical protein